jgi:hydroxyacylglutathione hydrolase
VSLSKTTAMLTLVAVTGAAVAIFAPYLGAEYLLRQHGALVLPAPTQSVQGRWYDDYFVIEPIDDATYAIGEPRYYQGNYSYLIIGTDRAILFDAGTGNRDITAVVRSLTALPVTVFPSHLHFDHVGAINGFAHTALLDLPSLRARMRDRRLTLGRYEFLGFADALREPRFSVDEWWTPDSTIDIGGRQLRVLWTPGHTPTSGSLYEPGRHLLFAGDYLYPSSLYVFLPGASRSAYQATARRLLATLDPATRIYGAHDADDPGRISAPVMSTADLQALARVLAQIQSGTVRSHGFFPRAFQVRGPITLETGFPWNNR